MTTLADMREPRYQVVARTLRSQIAGGQLPKGAQLPTEMELVGEGFVTRTRGRVTFVRGHGDGYVRQFGSVDDLMSLSEDTRMRIVTPLTRRVDRGTADRLRLSEDLSWCVSFVRLHGETPFCYTCVSLPATVARLLADVPEVRRAGTTSDITIIGLIDAAMPRRIAQAQQSITVGKLPASAVTHLGGRAGDPTLLVDRLYFDTEGEAVELSVSHFLPQYYSYRVQLQRG